MIDSLGIPRPVYDVRKHIAWKLSEAEFFLKAMESHSTASLGSIRFNDFTWTPENVNAAQQCVFYFSAMLSAWQTVYNYMKKHCKRKKPQTEELEDAKAANWFRSLRGKRSLWAFSLLRNSDIHDGVLEKPGVQYTVNMDMQATNQEFCLNGRLLTDRDCFQTHPWALDLLTQRGLAPIARDALDELRQVIDEGMNAGHLAGTSTDAP